MKQYTVIISGGTGFIGSNLINELILKKWHVHVIARNRTNTINLIKNFPSIDIHIHDGSTENLIFLFKKINADLLFHLATYYKAEHIIADVVPMLSSNVIFGTQLLEAMSNSKTRKLVNVGTTWQNFNDNSYNPVCLYAATKQAFEDIQQFYVESFNISSINLKLTDTFSFYDKRDKILNYILKSPANTTILMSEGNQIIDILHISDVISGLLISANLLLENKLSNKNNFSLKSNEQMPLKELVHKFIHINNLSINIKWGGKKYRNREVMTPFMPDPLLPTWIQKYSIFSVNF